MSILSTKKYYNSPRIDLDKKIDLKLLSDWKIFYLIPKIIGIPALKYFFLKCQLFKCMEYLN